MAHPQPYICGTILLKTHCNGAKIFGGYTVELISIVSAGTILLSLTIALYRKLHTYDSDRRASAHWLVSFLFVLILLAFAFNYLLNNALWPIARKTIILHPLSALLIYFFVSEGLNKFHKIRFSTALVLITLFSLIFIRAYDHRLFREWWYDRDTKIMAHAVLQDCIDDNRVCNLAVNWLFHPTTNFYITTTNLQIELSPYSHQINWTNEIQYYYLNQSDTANLDQSFILFHKYNTNRLLLKKN